MLPASVARFRIWTEPTTAAASASAGWSRATRSSATMSVIIVRAPIASPTSAPLTFPDLRVELLDPLDVDHVASERVNPALEAAPLADHQLGITERVREERDPLV